MKGVRTHNFTGKSDFWDWCNMHYSPSFIIKNATVFLNNAKVSLTKEEDLIPYFTHLISAACCSGDQMINLSKESYLDTQEKEHLSHIIYKAIKLLRKKKSIGEIKMELVDDGSYPEEVLIDSIIKRIETFPEITKFHLDKNYIHALNFIEEYIIPHYFYNIHTERFTKARLEFLSYATLNGYKVEINQDGEYHPIIWNMKLMVDDYNKMMKEGII